jgi:hypothetical protein
MQRFLLRHQRAAAFDASAMHSDATHLPQQEPELPFADLVLGGKPAGSGRHPRPATWHVRTLLTHTRHTEAQFRPPAEIRRTWNQQSPRCYRGSCRPRWRDSGRADHVPGMAGSAQRQALPRPYRVLVYRHKTEHTMRPSTARVTAAYDGAVTCPGQQLQVERRALSSISLTATTCDGRPVPGTRRWSSSERFDGIAPITAHLSEADAPSAGRPPVPAPSTRSV